MKTRISVLALALVPSCAIACSGAQAPSPVGPAEVRQALCVAAAVKAAGDPRKLSPEGAVALAGAVVACAPASGEGDAGAR